MPTLEQTVYDVAKDALRQQEHALTELRARTGMLLTASSLTASFLGAQAIARSGLSLWVALALIAFGFSVTLSIYALLPKRGVSFALDAPEVYAALFDARDSEGAIQYRLANWLQTMREGNHVAIRRVTRVFELAAFGLLVEIGLLSIGLVVA